MIDKIIKQISTVFEVPESDVVPAATPETIANWDSLRHMNLILALEMEFGIEIPPDRIIEMLSVQQVIDTVQELVE